MMRLLRCPQEFRGWDYDFKNKVQRERILQARCERLLVKLRREKQWLRPAYPLFKRAKDTRSVHRNMFFGMAPLCFPYFIGHYRGTRWFRCLRTYPVGVNTDALVGAPPQYVSSEMKRLCEALDAFRSAFEAHATKLTEEQKLKFAVEGAAFALAEFLRIHPYANGNGHMGRFIVWALLLLLGYVPRTWPMEERPEEPRYSNSLYHFLRGNRVYLYQILIDSVRGVPSTFDAPPYFGPTWLVPTR